MTGIEIALLPLDLARWDQAPGGDLFAVPVSTDVRPLRGAAGLLDWRLNGHLSQCLREERFQGARGEKLLIPTSRIPWRAVLAVGVGPGRAVDADCFGEALAAIVATARGLGAGRSRLAVALPGRELGALEPARAAGLLREALERGLAIGALTVVDTAAALKIMGELLGVSGTARARPAVAPRPRGA